MVLTIAHTMYKVSLKLSTKKLVNNIFYTFLLILTAVQELKVKFVFLQIKYKVSILRNLFGSCLFVH